MIILDTCALVFDALSPETLGKAAKKSISSADKSGSLACCDISLWEIGMLIQKKRIKLGVSTVEFLDLILQARGIQVLNITSEIAALSTESVQFKHGDPADRIIAATTMHHRAKLITCDRTLQAFDEIVTIWD
jgi:PIN domain nuclease of toxin-antitoxin system